MSTDFVAINHVFRPLAEHPAECGYVVGIGLGTRYCMQPIGEHMHAPVRRPAERVCEQCQAKLEANPGRTHDAADCALIRELAEDLARLLSEVVDLRQTAHDTGDQRLLDLIDNTFRLGPQPITRLSSEHEA